MRTRTDVLFSLLTEKKTGGTAKVFELFFFFFFFEEKNVLFFQERKSDRGWRRKRTTWIVPICIRGTEKQRKRERFLMFFSWQKVN